MLSELQLTSVIAYIFTFMEHHHHSSRTTNRCSVRPRWWSGLEYMARIIYNPSSAGIVAKYIDAYKSSHKNNPISRKRVCCERCPRLVNCKCAHGHKPIARRFLCVFCIIYIFVYCVSYCDRAIYAVGMFYELIARVGFGVCIYIYMATCLRLRA